MGPVVVTPKLYDIYDRNDVIAACHDYPNPRRYCDGQWLVWEELAICFADLGDAHHKSYFQYGGIFAWVAEKPFIVTDNPLFGFLPNEVFGAKARDRRIWLFVRRHGTSLYQFLGQMLSCHQAQSRSELNFGEAYFPLRPALPAKIWRELRGFALGNLNHGIVDAALTSLKSKPETSERLEILKVLIHFWHKPISEDDGMTINELNGIKMPSVLQWWYQYAGHRTNIVSGQNVLMTPGELKQTDDQRLIFYGENQWSYQWATLTEGDDPPVFGREDDSQAWSDEGITLSEHLILACLFEGIICHSSYGASTAWLSEEAVLKIIEHIPAIAISGWRWCERTRFFGGNGAFMFVAGNRDINGQRGNSVWIGAKTAHPLAFLKPVVDDSWDFVSVQ